MTQEKSTPDKTRVKRKYQRRKKTLTKLLTDTDTPVNNPNPKTDTTELGQIHMIVSTLNAMDESTKNRVLNYLFSRYENNITVPK